MINHSAENGLSVGRLIGMGALNAKPPDNEPEDSEILSTKDFQMRLADTQSGRNSANLLINRMYSRKGYLTAPENDRYANRLTLNAHSKDRLIGTLTISIDSPAGLLADTTFGQELHHARVRNRRLCEFTKLAFDDATSSKFSLAALFHICYIYARHIHGCTDAFIEVNPRHCRYYEKMLGFTREGGLKTIERVNAPAYLLGLDLAYVEGQVRQFGGTSDRANATRSLYPFFFSEREEKGIFGRLRELG